MPSAVLVAEPEPETREYLGRQLRDDGFDVLGAARRSEALELAETARPDVVLLAELELCLRLRRGEPGRSWDRNVPVIVLAPTSDPVERVRALDRGADDVMGRPFSYEELLARIRALLRRSSAMTGDMIVAGDLVIDRPTRRVHVRDTSVILSAKEFELVAKLASEPISRLHEGRSLERGMGLPRPRAYQDSGVACLTSSEEALRRSERSVRRERLGRGLSHARLTLHVEVESRSDFVVRVRIIARAN